MGEGNMLLLAIYGLLLGARHALEPDHLAAVSTMAAHGSSRGDVLRVSAAWGAGHASLVAAVGITLTSLGWTLPPALARQGEPFVGVALIAVGIWTLWEIRRSSLHVHEHTHDSLPAHTHIHVHDRGRGDHTHPAPAAWVGSPWAAYLVGTLHGLAGSGAAAALAVLAAPTPAAAAIYLLLFGAGSLVGMVAVGVFAMWPLIHLAARAPRIRRLVQGLAGSGSIAIGVFLLTHFR